VYSPRFSRFSQAKTQANGAAEAKALAVDVPEADGAARITCDRTCRSCWRF